MLLLGLQHEPTLYGHDLEFISSSGSIAVCSYLLLINIKFTLELVLSKAEIPTQMT